jgi:TolB-like protein/DNA-binding winged helix-turn-helix (wHTH) protein/Tfp pilus assembly protein PilF
MEPLRHISVVRFGIYEVSFQTGEIRKGGAKIKVQQQPMKLLEILLERPGEVFTREELRSRIWANESFGDFDQAVNIAVAKLRTALGDSADNPRFIETIPKRGYRFIAEVFITEADGDSPKPQVPEHNLHVAGPGHQEERTGRVSRLNERLLPRRRSMFAIAGVLAVLIVGAFLVRSYTGKPAQIRSLAVLPLDNLSGDPSQDYFADGMTDELITSLAQIKALRVTSRTSVMAYKRAHKPLPEIARELNVDAIIEGSVLRSGDQVRITAQLIQAPSDKHLWADAYEGNLRDTLPLQKKVALAIADQIRIELTPEEHAELRKVREVNPEAYEAYLKGRYFWNKRTADGLNVAVAYFKQAIAEDGKYAEAYAGLADSYNLLGDWEYGTMAPAEAYPKAKASATKALELDNTVAEAHSSLAFSFDVFDWDWDSAAREFKRAIELSPGYATAHQWYAWHLIEMGQDGEAIAEMRQAEHLDPLSLIISADMAEILLVAHRNDEAIAQSRKTVDMDPNFAVAHFELGQAFAQAHNYGQAITELQLAVKLSGGSTACYANLAYTYARSNRRGDAERILAILKARLRQNPSEIALMYVGLGENDHAMVWLETAYKQRFNPSILLRPAFDPLRSDARFQRLVHQIGIPA